MGRVVLVVRCRDGRRHRSSHRARPAATGHRRAPEAASPRGADHRGPPSASHRDELASGVPPPPCATRWARDKAERATSQRLVSVRRATALLSRTKRRRRRVHDPRRRTAPADRTQSSRSPTTAGLAGAAGSGSTAQHTRFAGLTAPIFRLAPTSWQRALTTGGPISGGPGQSGCCASCQSGETSPQRSRSWRSSFTACGCSGDGTRCNRSPARTRAGRGRQPIDEATENVARDDPCGASRSHMTGDMRTASASTASRRILYYDAQRPSA